MTGAAPTPSRSPSAPSASSVVNPRRVVQASSRPLTPEQRTGLTAEELDEPERAPGPRRVIAAAVLGLALAAVLIALGVIIAARGGAPE